MREYTTEQLRNVALVGHQSSGKTSLVEALLFNTGAITRQGKIEEKNTVSDWEDDAKERGLSLSTSLSLFLSLYSLNDFTYLLYIYVYWSNLPLLIYTYLQYLLTSCLLPISLDFQKGVLTFT